MEHYQAGGSGGLATSQGQNRAIDQVHTAANVISKRLEGISGSVGYVTQKIHLLADQIVGAVPAPSTGGTGQIKGVPLSILDHIEALERQVEGLTHAMRRLDENM